VKSAKALFFGLALAMLLGVLVLVINKNYRQADNMISNRNFYSILSQK
jgi:hypothetical protein